MKKVVKYLAVVLLLAGLFVAYQTYNFYLYENMIDHEIYPEEK